MLVLWLLITLSDASWALPNKPINAVNLVPRSVSQVADYCSQTGSVSSVVGHSDVTTVNSAGSTVIANTNGAVTLPTGITAPITTTYSNGQVTTIDPSTLMIETTNSVGATVYSDASGAITIPTGATTLIETILPNGESTTITPVGLQPTSTPNPITSKPPLSSSSSGAAGAFIVPITTPVPSPELTGSGVILPCDFFWFFNVCPSWDDISITGWSIDIPQGVHPPGPPPPFKPPPSISISISAPLPDWPLWTLPPSGTPIVSPKPDNCKTKTGELCFYETAFSTITSNEVTTTTSEVSSTCATVIGCDVENLSSSTSITETFKPTPITYAVYPSDGTNTDQTDSISNQLNELVSDPSSIKASITKTFGLNFWLLPLNVTAADKARAIPDVGSIWLNCGDTCPEDDPCTNPCYDPTTALVYDDLSWADGLTSYLADSVPQLAKDQMSYLSWPPSEDVAPQRFTFDDTAGEGITVYILDTGANLGKSEFDVIRDQVRWLPTNAVRDDGRNGREEYHGTAMLSLVAGQRLGVAKNVNPVIVRLPGVTFTQVGSSTVRSGFSPQDWIEGLSRINDDLGKDPVRWASCVVLLAQYFPRSMFENNNPGSWTTRAHGLIRDMISKGAVVVTGSSNLGRGSIIDGWPATFGKPLMQNELMNIPSLIVAGAISGDGKVAAYAYDNAGGIPHVYAPGDNIIVANGDPGVPLEYKGSKGTSDAAAYTAGLAAYFMKLVQNGQLHHPDGSPVENSPQGIKDFIVNTVGGDPGGSAWSRMPVDNQDRPGIFNAIDINQQQCPYDPTSSSLQPRAASNQACVTGPGPIPPTKPLEIQPVSCHDPSNFKGHNDISESAVSFDGEITCTNWINDKIGPNDSPLSNTIKTSGTNYEFGIEWIKDCVTTVSTESVWSPLGPDADAKDQCDSIFYNCWKNCLNTGVGGYIDVGCLRYTFTGGKGDN